MSNLVATLYSFVFAFILAESSSPSKADKLPSPPIPPFLQDFFSNNPVFAWLFWLFTALTTGIAAVAALTVSLQKIIDFCKTNLLRKQAEVSEAKLLQFRKELLKRLKKDISDRKKYSLHNLIKIDVEMEEQHQQVGRRSKDLVLEDPEHINLINPVRRVVRFFHRDDRQTTQLRPTQKIIDFFDDCDIQGKLLILGEPGAGKTTELLSLTQDLIQRAIEDENFPIPIIFELSTWKNILKRNLISLIIKAHIHQGKALVKNKLCII